MNASRRGPALLAALVIGSAAAQDDDAPARVGVFSDASIRESAIAFVNMTTSPGLEGATLEVDDADRYSEQTRSSLGFTSEFGIRNHVYNGYGGLALVGGTLRDDLDVVADDGEPVRVDLTRDVLALRGSLGLSFPIDQHLKVRTFVSLVAADLDSKSTFDEPVTLAGITSDRFDTSAQLLSTVGSLEALYTRWYGDHKLDLSAVYHLIYTDAYSDDNPVLDTHDLNDAAKLASTYSGPTSLVTAGRPWRWNVYAAFTTFISHDELALGYDDLLEIGGGLDWHLNLKPLDWFGWQTLGVSAGLIVGENVEGFKVGLTAQ